MPSRGLRGLLLALFACILIMQIRICNAQPERFGLPERLTDLTVLGTIAQRADLAPFDHFEILATWLIREYRDPSPGRRGLGGPVDSGWILFNIMGHLYVKGDALSIAEIAADAKAEPVLRDAMYIVLGLKGDATQATKLISILQNHELPYFRARAAEALGLLGAVEAIPALEKALADEYVVEIWPDAGPPDNKLFYPVRQYAKEALLMLQDSQKANSNHEKSRFFAAEMKKKRTAMADLKRYLCAKEWQIAWNKNRTQVSAINEKVGLKIIVKNDKAIVNGKSKILAPAPSLQGNQILVPRSFCVAMAYQSSALSKLARTHAPAGKNAPIG